jgi:excisionase family DNA binding protein
MDLDRIVKAWPNLPRHIQAAMLALLDVADVTDDGDMLTPPEAAERIGVAVSTLALWRTQKKGPPYHKAGDRLVRYRRVELDAWLESGRVNAVKSDCPFLDDDAVA